MFLPANASVSPVNAEMDRRSLLTHIGFILDLWYLESSKGRHVGVVARGGV